MGQPILLAVVEDRPGLENVETQLVQRYGRDYRVECLADPDEAVRRLTTLARDGEDLALALAATPVSRTTGSRVLERVRELHPHAKRALLVPPDVWADRPTGDAVRESMALGRIDYYVRMPAGSPDEVFHEAVSSFLLEWARDRRIVPHTVHVVAETWSGRAHELRGALERCAVPHAFFLAESDEGRELVERAGLDVKLPLMVLPDGRVLSDPSNAEIAEAAGAPRELEETDFDIVIVGAGPAGLSAAVYGASEGPARPRGGRGRHRRPGHVELADPQLPRLPQVSAAADSPSRPTSRRRPSARASCSCTGRPPSPAPDTGSPWRSPTGARSAPGR